jgi:hypothetical protein
MGGGGGGGSGVSGAALSLSATGRGISGQIPRPQLRHNLQGDRGMEWVEGSRLATSVNNKITTSTWTIIAANIYEGSCRSASHVERAFT